MPHKGMSDPPIAQQSVPRTLSESDMKIVILALYSWCDKFENDKFESDKFTLL